MKSMLASLVLLPALAFAAPGHVTYFASPTGGAYNHGYVAQVVGDQRTVIYDFCAVEPCLDGAAPLSTVYPQADGNVIGVTSEGGNGNHGRGGPDGAVFVLVPGPHGSWSFAKGDLCMYWLDCDHYGYPIMVRNPKPYVLEIVNCMRDCRKGMRSRFKIFPQGSTAMTSLQRWAGE